MRTSRPLTIFAASCTLVTVLIYVFRRQHWHEEDFQALMTNALSLYHSSNETDLARCPSPYLDPSISLPSTQQETECVSVVLSKASSSRFSASICSSTTVSTCNTFDLVIKRNQCDEFPDMHLSSSMKEEEFMRQQLGPDTFHIAITGTELYATVKPTKYSRCSYRYSIPLSNAGAWKIQLWHIYEKYEGLSEIYEETGTRYPFHLGKAYSGELVNGKTPRWPRNLNEPLLDGGFDGLSATSLNLPSSISCPTECPKYAFPKTRVSSRTRNADLSPRQIQPAPGRHLPLCSSTEPIRGAYLPDPSPLHQLETAPWTYYKWQPIGCRLREDVDLLLSNPDEMNELDKERRERCLMRKKTLLMQGDSHLRMTYDALVTRLNGTGEAPIYYKSKRKEQQIGQFRIKFIWDAFLEDLGKEDADIVLLTAGAHQANDHFLANEFFQSFRGAIRQLLKWTLRHRIKIIYLTSPSRPPRGLPYGFSQRDWRTNPRMQSWGREALNMLQQAELNVASIEGYETSLPLYKCTPDEAHFHNTPAMESWLQQIVHHSNLCELE